MFKLEDLKKIVRALDPTKAYRRHVHWKYAPIPALNNLLDSLNAFWVEHHDIGDYIWQELLKPIPKSNDKDLSLVKSWRPISTCSSEAYIWINSY